jgi:hypothetical protein
LHLSGSESPWRKQVWPDLGAGKVVEEAEGDVVDVTGGIDVARSAVAVVEVDGWDVVVDVAGFLLWHPFLPMQPWQRKGRGIPNLAQVKGIIIDGVVDVNVVIVVGVAVVDEGGVGGIEAVDGADEEVVDAGEAVVGFNVDEWVVTVVAEGDADEDEVSGIEAVVDADEEVDDGDVEGKGADVLGPGPELGPWSGSGGSPGLAGCGILGRLLPPPPYLILRATLVSATWRIGTSALSRCAFSRRIAALAFACRASGIEPASANNTAELVPDGHPVAMRRPVLSFAWTCPTTEGDA